MNKSIMISALFLGCLVYASGAHAKLNVFACEPEWAALANELGGDNVKTTSATNGLQDPHYIEARPSLIAAVRNADLVICSGSQLEIGWLPMLLSKANNPSVLPGRDGFLEAAAYVKKLDVPDRVDRAQGDVHTMGNPHFQINPHNIAIIARVLGERLASLDAPNAAGYAQRTADFLARWNEAITRWEALAAPLRGKRVVAHHKAFVYLEEWLGLQELATLEPLPGIPPSSAHLAGLLNLLGTDGSGADVIIRESYQNPKASEWLSDHTKVPNIMLPMSVGGTPEAKDLFSLFDDIISRLLGARA
jgi:zinc/manganese transport system substrate-binding protein